ncbi:cytosine permease [Streptomyces ochraceiscleroticus]|uniref:cytosine permease n=1 Tax=Streptomyces ochraceiscleroticus TaxID=47761 RepID=UPI0004C5675A
MSAPFRQTPAAAIADRTGQPEAHGIDHIPDGERHGRPRELFSVWAAPNVSYLSLVVGAALVLMGLTLVQALVVIAVGNLLWVLTGWLISAACLALNWSAASVAGIGLAGRLGAPDSRVIDAVIICAIAAVTLVVRTRRRAVSAVEVDAAPEA